MDRRKYNPLWVVITVLLVPYVTFADGAGQWVPQRDSEPQIPVTEPLSAERTGAVAEDALPAASQIGQVYGAAQNPNNSTISPDQTAAVNDATGSGLEMNAAIDEMEAHNKILAKDALALKTLLALQMMNASQNAAGGASVPGPLTSSGASNPSRAANSDSGPSAISTPAGIAPVDTYTPQVNTVSIPNSQSEGASQIPSPVQQLDSVVIGENSPSDATPYKGANSQPTVFLAPGGAADYFSRGVAAKVSTEDAPRKSEDAADRPVRGIASLPVAGAGATLQNQEGEGAPTREALTAVINRVQKNQTKKNAADEKTPVTAAAIPANGAVKVVEDRKPLPYEGKSALDQLGEKLSKAFGDSLWPDKKGKAWKGANRVITQALGIDEHSPAAARISAVTAETIPWLFGLFLLGVLSSAAVLLIPRIRNLMIRKFPLMERLLPRKIEFLALLPEASHEYQTQIIGVKRFGGKLHWQLGLRHKTNGEFVVVGVPKEDAVFPAQCLPTRLQNELEIHHGLERVQFLGKGGFKKTSAEVNPAFRPFPDKIGFLQSSGLLRGGKRSAA